jgi:energy-converting hydrogenase B subunit Q
MAKVPLEQQPESFALSVEVNNRKGVLHELTGVISRHDGNITAVSILDSQKPVETVLFEVIGVPSMEALIQDLAALPNVVKVEEKKTLKRVFGKRIIIIGGGAQVGQVAVGAVMEADRHNLRGERISVDTIPLVGENDIAEAVRAVGRLPRARALVLAGALMGGEIDEAVREVQAKGLLVISLNMVVSDPIQAGVMAVMAIADTAKFDIARLKKTRY